MANDKKPEELSEDDLGAVTGGSYENVTVKYAKPPKGGKNPGKGGKTPSKPVSTQAGASPDD